MSDTRERILDTTQLLLQERTYRGVSYQEIADRVGIRKASMFHHFRSKDELIGEVLRRSREHAAEWHRTLPLDPPAESLLQFLRQLGAMLGAGSRICAGGACVPAWDEIGDEVRHEALGLWQAQEAWVRSVLSHGRTLGVFRSDCSLEVQLELLLSAVQGALLVARARSDQDLFDRVTEALVAQLRA